jgi:hypothetical protein
MVEPPWIVTARSLIGKVEDGPAVVDLAHKLAAIYPEYAPYLRLVHDDTPWCGEFVAYCLAERHPAAVRRRQFGHQRLSLGAELEAIRLRSR